MNKKIQNINAILAHFFKEKSNPRQVRAKDLMPLFVKNGVFKNDSMERPDLPIRNLLRELDKNNNLGAIPYVVAERKKNYTYWYFADI